MTTWMERTARVNSIVCRKKWLSNDNMQRFLGSELQYVEHSVNGSSASLASRLIIKQYNKRNQNEIKPQMFLLFCNHYYKVQYSLERVADL